ncbi:MAG TPA: hypothetical protein VLE53_03540 [Gemmatimonadaceae bacterium]|nr:hypothetical protein [Gemmatimonadaceae bacterium]
MLRGLSARPAARRVLLAAAVVAWHIAGTGTARAQSIPARLSDSTFWRLITELSEPGGSFISDNFVSNELAFQYVIPELCNTVQPGGVYLGVGPDQNFTYIVALEPQIAFIVDIRRQNMVQHLMYKALIETSADRAEFLSRLFSRARPAGLDTTSSAQALLDAYAAATPDSALFARNLSGMLEHLRYGRSLPLTAEDSSSLEYVFTAFFGAGPDLTYAVGRMYRGFGSGWPSYRMLMTVHDGQGAYRSYLANEALFRRLKDLQSRNLIVPIVGDFGGPSALRQVGAWVRRHGAKVSTFYTSNVEQYLFQQGSAWQRFYESVASMPLDSTAMFIRSVSNRSWVVPQHPGSRSASMLSSIPAQLVAYRDGHVLSYQDVVWLSR